MRFSILHPFVFTILLLLGACGGGGAGSGGEDDADGAGETPAIGYYAQGAKLYDPAGEEVQLRGINMYGFNADILIPEYLWEMGWKEQIQQVKDLGFNAVRLPFVPKTLYSPLKAGEDLPTHVEPTLNADLIGKTPLEIISWANLMPGQGVQAAHIHNLGWMSGVYYPKVPKAVSTGDNSHAGWLGFGQPGYDIPSVRPPPMRFLAPEAGLLVCFPSYIWHWTEPFEGDEERVSVAFDVA